MSWTREQWVAAWRASGLAGTKFAEQHGLKAATLYGWGRRFGEGQASPSNAVVFAEVCVRPREQVVDAEAAIEIVASNGRVVRVRGRVDADALRAVLEVVERC